MVKALDLGLEGRGFESRSRQFFVFFVHVNDILEKKPYFQRPVPAQGRIGPERRISSFIDTIYGQAACAILRRWNPYFGRHMTKTVKNAKKTRFFFVFWP